MNTNSTPTPRTTATLELDADGGLTLSGGDLHIALSPGFLLGNRLFDEENGVDVYDEDSDTCAEILVLLATAQGFTITDHAGLRKAVRLACTPGPGFNFDPADFEIEAWYTGRGDA